LWEISLRFSIAFFGRAAAIENDYHVPLMIFCALRTSAVRIDRPLRNQGESRKDSRVPLDNMFL